MKAFEVKELIRFRGHGVNIAVHSYSPSGAIGLVVAGTDVIILTRADMGRVIEAVQAFWKGGSNDDD